MKTNIRIATHFLWTVRFSVKTFRGFSVMRILQEYCRAGRWLAVCRLFDGNHMVSTPVESDEQFHEDEASNIGDYFTLLHLMASLIQSPANWPYFLCKLDLLCNYEINTVLKIDCILGLKARKTALLEWFVNYFRRFILLNSMYIFSDGLQRNLPLTCKHGQHFWNLQKGNAAMS